MNNIEKVANVIATEISKKESLKVYALDPFMINIIICIIINIIKLYLACNKNSNQIFNSIEKLNIIERWRLKKIIKHYLDDEEIYELFHKEMFKAFIKIASELKASDVDSICEIVISENQN